MIFRNRNSILQGNRIDSVETMKHSENIYDSLFGWLLFIWLFFTLLFPPVTFSQPGIFHVYVFRYPSEKARLAFPRAGPECPHSSLLSSLFFKVPLSSAALPVSCLSLPFQSSHCILRPHPGKEIGASGSSPVCCSRESHHHCKVALGINRLRAYL